MVVNIWHEVAGVYVDYNFPSLIVNGNLAIGRRVNLPFEATITAAMPWLLLPALTDIRQQWNGLPPDMVEVPAGSNRFYGVIGVDDIGKGFANEHRFAILDPYTSGALFTVQGAIPAPVPLP